MSNDTGYGEGDELFDSMRRAGDERRYEDAALLALQVADRAGDNGAGQAVVDNCTMQALVYSNLHIASTQVWIAENRQHQAPGFSWPPADTNF